MTGYSYKHNVSLWK